VDRVAGTGKALSLFVARDLREIRLPVALEAYDRARAR
jgi:hypothetical protein